MSDLVVAPCSYGAAKYAVMNWHYSRRMPVSPLVRYGVWEDDEFVGFLRNKIGDQHPIDASISKLIAQRFESEREQRIQITKQHQRCFCFRANPAGKRKNVRKVNAVCDGAL